MIIYNGTSAQFCSDVDMNLIDTKIEENFLEKLGHRESPNEKRAWRNSLRYMETAVRHADIADDCGILIEYMIPNTSNRVDFIVTGEDEEHNQNYVLVELKQWESAEATDIHDLVRTFVVGGFRNVNHPSYQADTYNRMMQNMNEGIYENRISGFPCAYLHNYVPRDPEPLLDDRYRDVLDSAPVFFENDYDKLEKCIHRYVSRGKGMDILYEIENGRIRPSRKLVECVDSLYRGNDEFILMDEQNVAYQTILKQLQSLDEKKTIIVKGGPGTGKSVISFKVLHELIDRRLNAKFVAPNAAFRETMVKKLIADKADKSKNVKQLFCGSSVFYGVPEDYYDVLVVDEAHRLKGKGAYMYQGVSQIDDIIHASKLNVFFVDDGQQVRPDDIGTVSAIRESAARENSAVFEMELKSQYRCAGAEGFISWVTDVLQIEETANYDGWDQDAFEFRLVNDPNRLYDLIREKNDSGFSARLTAGFAWKWSKDKHAETADVVIPEYHFSMPWNERTQRELYAIKPDSVGQIGCIHTVQGLEFDYIGVIIGKDLRYDPEKQVIYGDYDSYKDSTGKKGLKGQPEKLTAYIKNIYKVLMSRGMKGCYIFCCDPELQKYFARRLQKISSADTGKETR